jgi:hypothetical protein
MNATKLIYSKSWLEKQYKITKYCYTFNLDWSKSRYNIASTKDIDRSPLYDTKEEAIEWMLALDDECMEIIRNLKLCEYIELRSINSI